LRFAATRLGKLVEPAMMQDEAAEKIPVRSRSGCNGPGARTISIEADDAGRAGEGSIEPNKGCRQATIVA
jgi:hypothetical protein